MSVVQAKLTLKAATQLLKQSSVMPLSCGYIVDRLFGVKRLDCIISTDTMHAKEQVIPRTELQASVMKYGINELSLERER